MKWVQYNLFQKKSDNILVCFVIVETRGAEIHYEQM